MLFPIITKNSNLEILTYNSITLKDKMGLKMKNFDTLCPDDTVLFFTRQFLPTTQKSQYRTTTSFFCKSRDK